jgi:hypothetical protein
MAWSRDRAHRRPHGADHHRGQERRAQMHGRCGRAGGRLSPQIAVLKSSKSQLESSQWHPKAPARPLIAFSMITALPSSSSPPADPGSNQNLASKRNGQESALAMYRQKTPYQSGIPQRRRHHRRSGWPRTISQEDRPCNAPSSWRHFSSVVFRQPEPANVGYRLL